MTQYARSVNNWRGVSLIDDERAIWTRTRPDLVALWDRAKGASLAAFVAGNRDDIDAVIVGDVAPWGEVGRLQYNEMGLPVVVRATCGGCRQSWNDALITSMTPVPSARCPFEYDHEPADD